MPIAAKSPNQMRSLRLKHAPSDIDYGSGEAPSSVEPGVARLVFDSPAIEAAPAGSDRTLTIPRSYTLHKADFGYSDADGNGFKSVIVTTLPGAGTLFYDSNGALGGGRSAVVAGQAISAADILAGKLTYLAPAGVSGTNYAHFTFQVRDDSGAGGGGDTDQSPNTLTFNLVASAATPTAFGTLIDVTHLTADAGFEILGAASRELAGASVAPAGDINGDGFADFIIGAPNHLFHGSGGYYRSGAAYVVFGKASGFSQVIDLSNLTAADGFRIQGGAFDRYVGNNVSSAGDINGDGFDDLIVGGYIGNRAYVIFGHAGGFDMVVNLQGMSAATGFAIGGGAAQDYTGVSVSSAGDINGDGFADLIVGAHGNDAGGADAGAAYVIFGRASSFGTSISVPGPSSTSGFRILGDLAGDIAGWSVASAGDVNADGFADIIVGAPDNDGGGTNSGAAYVIFGHAGAFGQIDFTTFTAADGFKIQGEAAGDFAGFRVSSAGDINGDGFADLLIGASDNDSGGTNAGAAYVIFGKSSGFGSRIDLAQLTPATGFRIQGDANEDRAGHNVAAAGDVNGDGYADILIRTSGNGGDAWLIFGKASGFGSSIDVVTLRPSDGFRISGALPTPVFGGLSGRTVGASDINGDGYADIIIGAGSNDSNGTGGAYVIFGHANTFLAPAGTDRTLTIPRSYVLHKADFGFSDPDGNAFKAVVFTTLPTAGTLYYDANGPLGGGQVAVAAGQAISAADMLAGKLTYVAPAGAGGPNYSHFTFQVRDDGGTAGGSVDTDESPNTLTFNLVASAATSTTFGSLIDLAGLSQTDGFKIQGDLFGDYAGVSVAAAGDINGDGLGDVIIGASGNDSGGASAGAAYVIFGKAGGLRPLIDLTGLAATDGFKIQGDQAGDRAGISVSSAGDVNGDGFADLIVGAFQNDDGGNYAGAAYVIFGKASGFGTLVDLTGLSVTDGFRIQGDVAGNFAGCSVSAAGDVNGDGFADIVVGAYGNASGGANAGAAYVIFGKPGGFGSLIDLTNLAPAVGFKIQGDLGDDRAGFSVSSAGDVNGDGFADIIVGAKTHDGGGTDSGAAYVIFGKSGGFGSLIDLSGLAATDGFRIQGDSFSDYAGISVASAGDVNGDGFADIIVGASNAGNGGIYAPGTGAAYIIFGKASGFGALIDLTGLAAPAGFKIIGGLSNDGVGISVSSAGDVNGDGYADILVGAVGNDGGGIDAGVAYVIFGKSSGFGSVVDLTNLAPNAGFKIQGDNAGDVAGRSVSSAGDINGDGYADILVGASGNGGGGGNAGAAYVIYGRSNVLSAPTGTDTTLTIGRSFTLHKADFGFSDVDGNGFKAVVVTTLPGAGTLYYDSNGALGGGRTVVVAGQAISAADILGGKLVYVAPVGASGTNYDHFTFQVRDDSAAGGTLDTDQSPNTLTFNLVATAATPTTFGTLIDLTGLSTSTGFKIQGDLAGDYAGFSVSSAGDINGDGFADIIVGAPLRDDIYGGIGGYTDAGAAYVIYGKASGFGATIDLSALANPDGFRIGGIPSQEYAGISVSSAGDLNGDGFADLVVGAYGNDDGGNLAGAAYVIFGRATPYFNQGISGFGFQIRGDLAGDNAGWSVSSAGDVNGDGFADLIVGAHRNDAGGLDAGAAYVIFGKAAGFGAILDLTGLTAADGFKIQGDVAKDYAGFSVSSAGDINGDGFADIIVGASGNDSGGTDAGAAYVIYGKASGFGSLIDLTGLPATVGFKIQGDFAFDNAGVSVACAGDVNGDGYADILIGASNNGGGDFGAGFLIYGKASGFGTLIDLTNITATDGFRIQSETALDRTRVTVSGAGDVNGDGFADIIVGVGNNDSGGTDAGAAYVIFGKASGFGSVFDLNNLTAASGFKIQGDLAGDNAGISVSAAGDVNSDGFADILVGAYKNDSGGTNAGAAYVIFGHATVVSTAGNDTAIVAENAVVTFNANANDSDSLTGLRVARVNGQNVTVGAPVTLASGAIVSLNSNGTLTYNPNHAFDATPAPGSGASNTPAHDSFTYTLTGGGTATVSVTITGIDTNDTLLGTAGADVLIGGIGADTMSGGLGNDVYFVDNAGDVVVEAVGEGNDRVAASVGYVLAAAAEVETIEAITQSATDALNFTGNGYAQTIVGNNGVNVLDGGGGNDVLVGLGGNDALIGGAGNDLMYGGTGNDTYYVQDTGDQVFESAGEGNDRIAASVSFALPSGSEVETIESITQSDTTALNFAGSELAQTIIGNNGANLLDGGGGNDVLVGLGGNDALLGGAGNDLMYGGTGNDTYYVQDTGDQVFESIGEGNDRIAASVSFALPSGSEVETIESITQSDTTALNFAGSEFAQTIIGNNGANLLDGGGGNDVLVGLGGNDALLGGSGNDLMYGGTGNDTYYVQDTGDQVFESVGEGNDRIAASVSFALPSGSEVETIEAITQSATDALNFTGSELAQTIIGNNGVNVLNGGGGNDVLVALGGNDALIGGSGNDQMYGGIGNDTYYVEDAGDQVFENAGEGNDRVAASVSFTLAAGSEVETIEAITQSATDAFSFTGNAFAQTLIGNNGANMLDGKGGNDVLVGFGGADTFMFTTAPGAGNVDTIADFASGTDKIALDHGVFTALATGALNPNAFVTSTAAQDADDRIIYDAATGNLFYDADGNGAGAAVLFANLTSHPVISAGDFQVI